jgi:hypothetical protein
MAVVLLTNKRPCSLHLALPALNTWRCRASYGSLHARYQDAEAALGVGGQMSP